MNPIYRNSFHTLAVTRNSEFVVQNTEEPTIFANVKIPPAGKERYAAMRGGITFWRIGRNQHNQDAAPSSDPNSIQHGELRDYLATADSFTVELPPYLQGRSLVGRAASEGFVFTLGKCRTAAPTFGAASPCHKSELGAVLHIVNWSAAQTQASTVKTRGSHPVISLADATSSRILHQLELPAGASDIAMSPDGSKLAITLNSGTVVRVLDLKQLVGLVGSKSSGESARRAPDEFGVSTLAAESVATSSVDIGGPTSGAVFANNDSIYVTALKPGRLLRINLKANKAEQTRELGFEPAGLMLPGGGTTEVKDQYAVVLNKKPHGRFVSVGPSLSLNPVLVDISSEAMPILYDMAVPQTTALWSIAFDASQIKTVMRYKPGTNSRTGGMSLLRTIAGQERVVREGNHVHVFASVIRSHITPDLVEVNEGETVTFHITNLEQAQDQTHGFTIDSYNVHGSWEPGKTASVTFVASRPGVYPFYCTEFCSALHLEMEGYLLVKPKGWKASKEDLVSSDTSQGGSQEEYQQRLADIKATQAKIDEVVAWLKQNNYEKEPRAAALVNDAVAQLEEMKKVQPKVDAAVAGKDWSAATLWAGQLLQYQVKAADAGLRAKKILSEAGGQ